MVEMLLIFGASVRAAAFSVLRSGLRPWCVDLFADVDLRNRCPASRLSGRYPHAFVDCIKTAPSGPWMYTGGLENWPCLVQQMAAHRALWGNAKSSLHRARNPEFIAQLLHNAGISAPSLQRTSEASTEAPRWLCKPRRSAGGNGVRFAIASAEDEPAVYYQEYIEGRPCSLLYVGDGRRAILLGMTWQLIGVSWLHAASFRYCGSIGPVDVAVIRRPSPQELGDVLAGGCGLCGLFGVDGILRDGVFWPVEINPRYTASVEVLEYAAAFSALTLHSHVLTHGRLPPFAPSAIPSECFIGKAILYAGEDVVFPADGPWMTEVRAPSPVQKMPAFADIPTAGERIETGHPILTLFARADSPSACEAMLRRSAANLDRWLFER